MGCRISYHLISLRFQELSSLSHWVLNLGVSDLPEVHVSRRRTEGRGWGGAPLGCCSCFCCWVRAEDHSQHVKLGGVTSWQGSESDSLFQPRNGAEWEQADGE